jgi:hypothetical protein
MEARICPWIGKPMNGIYWTSFVRWCVTKVRAMNEIRRRFGQAISRGGRKREQAFPLASETDYVELALPLRKKV